MEKKICDISTKFVCRNTVRVWHIKNVKSLQFLETLYSPMFAFTTETYSWHYRIILCYKEEKFTLKLEPMVKHKGFLQISYIIYDAQRRKITEDKNYFKNILELHIKNEVLQYDSIYIEFMVYYSSAESTQISNKCLVPTKMETWYQKMTKHFSELYLNPELSDITFYVEDSVFPAHKIVLAMYSQVFARMFVTRMKEQKERKVYISNFTAEAFNCMLCYMYTGELTDLRNLINELIFIAHMYEIEPLIEECIEFYINNMNDEIAWETLTIADKLNLKNLEHACCKYIITNMKSIASKKEFDDIKEHHVDIAMKLLDSIIDFSIGPKKMNK